MNRAAWRICTGEEERVSEYERERERKRGEGKKGREDEEWRVVR